MKNVLAKNILHHIVVLQVDFIFISIICWVLKLYFFAGWIFLVTIVSYVTVNTLKRAQVVLRRVQS